MIGHRGGAWRQVEKGLQKGCRLWLYEIPPTPLFLQGKERTTVTLTLRLQQSIDSTHSVVWRTYSLHSPSRCKTSRASMQNVSEGILLHALERQTDLTLSTRKLKGRRRGIRNAFQTARATRKNTKGDA